MDLMGKRGFFGFLFAILGFLIFLIALALIVLSAYFLIVYGYPAFKEGILNAIRK